MSKIHVSEFALSLINRIKTAFVVCKRSSMSVKQRVAHLTLMSFSQLTLRPNLTVASQRTLKLAASEAVHHIMTFDPSDRNFLYLMTSHHVSI